MHKWLKRSISAFTAELCLLGAVNIPSLINVSYADAIDPYLAKGKDGKYDYEVWNMDRQGNVEFENTENNGFTVTWSDIQDMVVQKSERFEKNKYFASQIKEYTVSYDADVDYMGGTGYTGAYGWMEDPLIEMYIIDSWGDWRPFSNSDLRGSFESNGITYDIYYQNNSPWNIAGDGYERYTYASVARENLAEKTDGTCHVKNTINVADHIKAWYDAGLKLSYLYYIGLSVQGWKSSGSVKVNSFEAGGVFTPQSNFGPEFPYSRHDALEPDEAGRTVYLDYENDDEKILNDNESCAVSYDTDHSFSGDRSVLVKSEEEKERSYIYEIDPYDFKSQDLVMGLKVLNNSDKNTELKIENKYTFSDGHTYNYEIFSKTLYPGRWKSFDDISFKLSNDIFTKNTIVVTTSEPVDLNIDDFFITDKETYSEKQNNAAAPVRGDMNSDNSVDVFDVIALRNELLCSDEYTINTEYDVNGDYKLNISDLILLTKFVLGKTDKLPEPERRSLCRSGNFNERIGEYCYETYGHDNKSYNKKSVIYEDGGLISQWDIHRNYTTIVSQDTNVTAHPCIKYSGVLKTTGADDDTESGHIKLLINETLTYKDKTMVIKILEGEDKPEYSPRYFPNNPDKYSPITLNGNDYYISQSTIDGDIIINLYRKENAVKRFETSHLENEIDTSEILKYCGMEEFTAKSVSIYFESNNLSGYLDLSDISFGEKK